MLTSLLSFCVVIQPYFPFSAQDDDEFFSPNSVYVELTKENSYIQLDEDGRMYLVYDGRSLFEIEDIKKEGSPIIDLEIRPYEP